MVRPVSVEGYAAEFRRGYKRKSEADRRLVENAIARMAVDLSHRSLRARPMKGFPGIWELRASRSVRITFEFLPRDPTRRETELVRLRRCCTHEQAYRRP